MLQGRSVAPEEVAWLRAWLDAHPHGSRKRLARELCQRWQWVDGRGRRKDFAARSLLLKLEAQGHLRLPPLQLHKRRPPRPAPQWPDWQEPAPWSAPLTALRPLRVEPVRAGTAAARRWAFYLHRYHYLGLRVVGENLGYLVADATRREVACLLFGAAAWRCAPRDQAFGWSDAQRRQGLSRVANNTRFLILPWVRVPHLASRILSALSQQIRTDWQAKYRQPLWLLETFVERERFAGTAYEAANWLCVGRTCGRGRQGSHEPSTSIKEVYVYPLHRRCRQHLNHPTPHADDPLAPHADRNP
jgi:hypothetical protein